MLRHLVLVGPVICGVVLASFPTTGLAVAKQRPNILVITVDDMSCDSVGVFGCKLKGTTPRIDRLASEGVRFKYAHVQVGNCMPSRNVMFSGRYPHNNGVEGFIQNRDPVYPVLADLMKSGGYFAAIWGKETHSTPYTPYPWDLVITGAGAWNGNKKNPSAYYRSTRKMIEASQEAGKPFCLNINISDPHKPFYAGEKDRNQPTRVYAADEVPVPGFLPDAPEVREELAQYYSSVRRADDCAGEVLNALKDSGHADDTIVMFFSDHGMPFPFAKTQLYHHSTHTPWIVRWPKVVEPNSVDDQHMISAIDLLPTLLDAAGIKHPAGLEGRSFLPLLRGKSQDGRDMVFKEYNQSAGRGIHPIRGVQTRRFGYLFNPWSDSTRNFKTATKGMKTYRVMQRLAETDAAAARRLHLFDHRVREEFYDYENDPDALHNLIDDPQYAKEIDRLRKALEGWMVRTNEPMLDAFRNRDDDEAVERYMATKESQPRKAKKRKKPKSAGAAGKIIRGAREQPPSK